VKRIQLPCDPTYAPRNQQHGMTVYCI
jgi:hypothetical protein